MTVSSPELLCYLHPGWHPRIRPANPRRDWMDDTPDSFAYRCLPLAIANTHGWEVLSPLTFEARWNGGNGADAIEIRVLAGDREFEHPSSIFGHGVLTFHVFGLLRTSPGWNLWVGGPPNGIKDGIAPLAGVIETDWSPYTFTMNWRFTRANHWIRFDENEPFCCVFPVQRGLLEQIQPRLVPMAPDSDLMQQFQAWSRSRDAFQREMERNPPKSPADRWQKRYFHGKDMHDRCPASDHQTKLRLKPFLFEDGRALDLPPVSPMSQNPPSSAHEQLPGQDDSAADMQRVAQALEQAAPDLIFSDTAGVLHGLRQRGFDENTAKLVAQAGLQHPLTQQGRIAAKQLRKREWLLDVQERQRALAAQGTAIGRVANIDGERFLTDYYAPGRPVVLTGLMNDWPALHKWTPDYLAQTIGDASIEYQGERDSNVRFERDKERHRRTMPFSRFIEMIRAEQTGNAAYLTAYNSASNTQALAPLHADLGFASALLDPTAQMKHGMLWIGPSGTFTPLHHDLTNNLVAQVVGRKRIRLVAAAHVAQLYNDQHVFSEIDDLDAIDLSQPRYAGLRDVKIHDITLSAGEMLFIPIGWWHQVTALDFSVTITYTNFRWRNDWYQTYPRD